MDVISYRTARENLANTMIRVCVDHTPIVITLNNEKSVVMVSLDDYNAMKETNYLLHNPINAKRLLESICQLDSSM